MNVRTISASTCACEVSACEGECVRMRARLNACTCEGVYAYNGECGVYCLEVIKMQNILWLDQMLFSGLCMLNKCVNLC